MNQNSCLLKTSIGKKMIEFLIFGLLLNTLAFVFKFLFTLNNALTNIKDVTKFMFLQHVLQVYKKESISKRPKMYFLEKISIFIPFYHSYEVFQFFLSYSSYNYLDGLILYYQHKIEKIKG